MIVIFVQQTRLLRFQIFHLEMDSTIKPIHYFIHSEQISKLEKIKAHWTPTKRLASSSESPNPRIGYRTWSSENGIGPHSNQGRTDTRMPGSLPDSQQGNPMAKVHHPHRRRKPTQTTRNEVPDYHWRQGNVPEHTHLNIEKGGHVGVEDQSFRNWILFWCSQSLFVPIHICLAADHVS